MSQFLSQTTAFKPVGIDVGHQEVNELTVQSINWTGVPVALTTVPVEGIEKIEILQTFVSGVALTSGVPTYPWYDLQLDGVPNNKLAGDAAVIRLYNTGERTLTQFTDRVVFHSNNPKGYNLRSTQVSLRRPDGTLCPSGDVGAWSVEFRITRKGGFRM